MTRPTGQLDPAVSHVTDILPTLLDAAELGYPQKFAGNQIVPFVGRSPVPALRGKSVADRQTIFCKNARGKAVRDGDWKLVSEARGGWELYNLAADPTELDNLASSNQIEQARYFSRAIIRAS